MNPELSVIVPVHNKASTLNRFLDAITEQTALSGCEVIFVDDGSTDGSERILQNLHDAEWAVVIQRSGRIGSAARSRNLALRRASAETCLFLDPDVVFGSTLFSSVLEALAVDKTAVLLLPVIGNSSSASVWPLLVRDAEGWEPMSNSQLMHWAGTQKSLSDFRLRLCRNRNGDLGHLPTPWTLCWSSGMALSRTLALTTGGFNEELEKKGSEDIEFAYRLHLQGSHFRLLEQQPILHLPHSRDRSAEERLDRTHERQMLALYPTREMELFCAFDGEHANVLYKILARIDGNFLQSLNDALTPPPVIEHLGLPQDGVLSGATPRWLLDATRPRNVISPVASTPSGSLPLLGFALPFDDNSLPCAVLSGLWQVLPERLACRVFAESLRVAARSFLLKTTSDSLPSVPWPDRLLRLNDAPYWERTHRISRSYFDYSMRLMGSSGSLSCYELTVV